MLKKYVLFAVLSCFFAFILVPDRLFEDYVKMDFASFYYAAELASDNENYYDWQTLNEVGDEHIGHVYPYIYTPFLAEIMQPLTNTDVFTAQGIWDMMNLLAFAACLYILLLLADKNYRKIKPLIISALILFLVISLPYRYIFFVGQVDPIVLFFVILSIYFNNKKMSTLSGAALAVATIIKLSPAVLILYFIFSQNYRATAAFFVTLLMLTVLTLFSGAYDAWANMLDFITTTNTSEIIGLATIDDPSNYSSAGFFSRIFDPGQAATLLNYAFLATLAAASAFVLIKLKSKDSLRHILPFLVLMVVSSPFAWRQHALYLLPGIFFFILFIMDGETALKKKMPLILILLIISISSGIDTTKFLAYFSDTATIPNLIISLKFLLIVTLSIIWATLEYKINKS